MKQKGFSDVKGSLWNHLDKNVLLWHREAPLFLRVNGILRPTETQCIAVCKKSQLLVL